MAVLRNTVVCLYYLIWMIHNFHCRADSCGPRKPIVKICTDDELLMQTSASIDTANVPKFQQISCKCTIKPARYGSRFFFSYYRDPGANMNFNIQNVPLDEDGAFMDLMGDADLVLATTAEFTIEGTCLLVSSTGTGNKFNITCTKEMIERTSPSTSASVEVATRLETSILPTYTEILSNSTEQHAGDNNMSDGGIIIPVVASVSGCICLVIIVVFLILFRRRLVSYKRKPIQPSSKAEKNSKHDYYMTENLMDNMTDAAPQNTQTSENEYDYIEFENHETCAGLIRCSSSPDSPVGAQVNSKPTSNTCQYDCSRCSSTRKDYTQKDEKQNQALYDRTDIVFKQTHCFNEYSHIDPKAVRNHVADDTYNTIGNYNKN